MAEIKHLHRLAGLDGAIVPERSDWQTSGEHTLVWQAVDENASLHAPQEATLDYVARGDGEETLSSERVEILQTRQESGRLRALLRILGKGS